MKIPRLMLITAGNLDANPEALSKIAFACQNGLPAIQLREKQMHTDQLWQLAKELRKLTLECGTLFSINERLDIALAVEADGVHFSEKGISPHIPKRLKPSLIVGVSVHSLQMGLRAQQEGADYILFGPLFETASKKCFGHPQGLVNLERMASTLSIPIIAVGGIHPIEAKSCKEAGAHGVAAIGAFMQAENVRRVIDDFKKNWP